MVAVNGNAAMCTMHSDPWQDGASMSNGSIVQEDIIIMIQCKSNNTTKGLEIVKNVLTPEEGLENRF